KWIVLKFPSHALYSDSCFPHCLFAPTARNERRPLSLAIGWRRLDDPAFAGKRGSGHGLARRFGEATSVSLVDLHIVTIQRGRIRAARERVDCDLGARVIDEFLQSVEGEKVLLFGNIREKVAKGQRKRWYWIVLVDVDLQGLHMAGAYQLVPHLQALAGDLRPIEHDAVCYNVLIFERGQANHCAVAVACQLAKLAIFERSIKRLLSGGELPVLELIENHAIGQVEKSIRRSTDP